MSSYRYSSDANSDIEGIVLHIFDLNSGGAVFSTVRSASFGDGFGEDGERLRARQRADEPVFRRRADNRDVAQLAFQHEGQRVEKPLAGREAFRRGPHQVQRDHAGQFLVVVQKILQVLQRDDADEPLLCIHNRHKII